MILSILRRGGACLLLLLLAACSGKAGLPRDVAPEEAQLPQPPSTSGLPSLAELAGLPASAARRVSKQASAIDGAAPVLQSGSRNYVEGSTLAILPGSDEDLAWAVYTQDGITDDKPVTVQFSLTPAAILPGSDEDLPMEFWVGLSNYTRFSWEWHGPYNSGNLSSLSKRASAVRKGTSALFTMTLNDEDLRERYVSRETINGDTRFSYVVLVTSTGDPDVPHAVKIESSQTVTSPDYLSNKPHAVAVFDPSVSTGGAGARYPGSVVRRVSDNSDDQVQLGWDHVPERNSSDLRNTAAKYRVQRQAPGGPVEFLGLVDAPFSFFADPPDPFASDFGYTDFPGRQPPTPGVDYTYSIKAFNQEGVDAGYVGPTSTPSFRTKSVFIELDPPLETYAQAVEGAVDSYLGVLVEWTEVEGAKEYSIWRQDSGGITEVGTHPAGGTSLLDTSAATMLPREILHYWVEARTPVDNSDPSPTVSAYVPDVADFLTVDLLSSNIRFVKVPGSLTNAPGGPFNILGSDINEPDHDTSEEEQQQLLGSDYWISETEITNSQWQDFIADGGYTLDGLTWISGGHAWRILNNVLVPPNWNQAAASNPQQNGNTSYPNHPVNDVSWYEAIAFATWVDGKYQNSSSPIPGTVVRLPNEAEWELAAKGPVYFGTVRLFPWGELGEIQGGQLFNGSDGVDMGRCNSADDIGFDSFVNQTSPVKTFALGRSWCGAYDMAGNVAEWTSERFQAQYGLAGSWNPLVFDGTGPSPMVAVRGGRCLDSSNAMRNCARGSFDPGFSDSVFRGNDSFEGVGVRLVIVTN